MTAAVRPIVVALDAEHTRQSDAGVARYARNLAAELRKRDDVSVVELGGGHVATRGTAAKRAITLRQDFTWYPWLGRRHAAASGADVYHIPIPRGPMRRGVMPLVVTVHDLVPLLFPETMTPWSRIHSRLTLRRVLDAADRIITPSQNTANDLASLLRVSADRVRVVHNGVDDFFFAGSAPAEVAPGRERPDAGSSPASARLGVVLANPYVLFVGTPEPRKNLHRLEAAMSLLRQRGFAEHLVTVGGNGWGAANAEGRDAACVHRLGRVSDADLRTLYANSSCLALPSLHEGFGLTALEAMAAGTPVVAANVGALPEVTGGAAVMVDPRDTGDIADGIARCISDRGQHVAAGLERASHFRWAAAASATVAVYRELI